MQSTVSIEYKNRMEKYMQEQQKIARQLKLIGYGRLVLFLVFAWFFYLAFRNRFQQNELVYALLTIPAFLLLLFLSSKIQAKNSLLEKLILINENELKVAAGANSLLDDGAAHIVEKGFSFDLNIFGNNSLFQLLNRAGSKTGKKELAARLSKPLLQPSDIKKQQSAVAELASNLSFRQNLLAHTLLLKEEEKLDQLIAGIPRDHFSVVENRFWKGMSIIWPLGGISMLWVAIYTGRLQQALGFIIMGLLLVSFIIKKLSRLYNHISKRSYLYNQYAECFQLICDQQFEHPYLQQQQEQVIQASFAFKRLARLGGLFDLRMSMLSIFINGLFLFDLLCARAYMRWDHRYQLEVGKWFDTLGEIELLNSLATFYYNHPGFIFPEPVEGLLLIQAEGMGHPLLQEEKAIVNDITIGKQEKIHLITGSNMSGKSTFLRTVGLNMILAQIGAPVFAKSFLFSPVQLLTSFHHIDSLSENTSYFYAELKTLQSIILQLNQPTPSLVLLDEVMRGTNSKDKHDGTALLIKKILNYACLSLIATHDTELGILENEYPNQIENCCFESELAEAGLIFDYKKRKGLAKTTNATYLMQQMGII